MLPWDIYRNTTSGRTWGVPNGYSGPAADGARIFQGGTSFSFVSWGSQPQTQQSIGGGGGGQEKKGEPLNKKKKAKYSQSKLEDCINKIFEGFVRNNWEYSYDRNAGSGSFSFEPVLPNGPTLSPSLGRWSARTNFDRTSSDLALFMNNENGGRTGFTNQSGYTSPNNQRFNWIASDVASNMKEYKDIGFRALFIHEMGNMMANMLNRQGWSTDHENPANETGDPDIGQKLEDCVFGGRVGLRSGRIGPSREL